VTFCSHLELYRSECIKKVKKMEENFTDIEKKKKSIVSRSIECRAGRKRLAIDEHSNGIYRQKKGTGAEHRGLVPIV